MEGTNRKEVFKARNYLKGPKITKILVLKLEDKLAHTFSNKYDTLLKGLFPTTAYKPQKLTRLTSKVIGSIEEKEAWPPLAPEELDLAFKSFLNNSALGLDRISYQLIKEVYKAYPEIFYNLYSRLFNQGYHPKD